jgi:hypothetical protein
VSYGVVIFPYDIVVSFNPSSWSWCCCVALCTCCPRSFSTGCCQRAINHVYFSQPKPDILMYLDSILKMWWYFESIYSRRITKAMLIRNLNLRWNILLFVRIYKYGDYANVEDYAWEFQDNGKIRYSTNANNRCICSYEYSDNFHWPLNKHIKKSNIKSL